MIDTCPPRINIQWYLKVEFVFPYTKSFLMWKQLQTLPDLRDFKLHTFKFTQFNKEEKINIFVKHVEFFRAEMKAQ